MIAGSSFCPLYYGFYCVETHFWRYFWLSAIGVTCIFAFLTSTIPTKPIITVNCIAFCTAAGSTTFGQVHLSYFTEELYGNNYPFWAWLSGSITYTVGAIIYALKIPEKYIRTRFDIVGASH